jgi:hypothetical protein
MMIPYVDGPGAGFSPDFRTKLAKNPRPGRFFAALQQTAK